MYQHGIITRRGWHSIEYYALDQRVVDRFVRAETRMLSVHVVGAHIDVTTFPNDVETGLVAIGLASEMNPQDLDEWWAKAWP